MSNKNIRTLSATTVPALSSLPGNIDPALKTFLNGLVQALEIRLGRRGDPRDRAVTLRELIDSGLAKELSINPYDPNAVGFTIPTGADTNVLTTSVTTPTGLTAVGGFTLVLLQWDLHSHLDHSHTEIWRHTSDDRNNSIHIGNAEFTRFFSDQSVVADTTYYYWIRHANEQGVISDWNAESGVSATTQPDIDFLLETLTGEIRNTHLYSTLATDVGRIPGWHLIIGAYDLSSGARTLTLINGLLDDWYDIIGEYSGRTLIQIDDGITSILVTTATHGTALTGIQNSIYVDGNPASGLKVALASALTSLTTDVDQNETDISSNATAVTQLQAVIWVDGDSSNALLYASALALNTTNANVASNASGITANASDITDLEVIVENENTGVTATANALDILETTVTGTGGHAGKITVLETKVNTTDGGMATANALDLLETTVTGTGGHASKITTLETKVNTTEGGMATANALGSLTTIVSGSGATSHASRLTALDLLTLTTNGGFATVNALSTTNANITTANNNITTNVSEITDLKSDVYDSGGAVKLASITALNSLSGTVSTQGTNITAVVQDITLINTQIWVAGNTGTLKVATANALSGLQTQVDNQDGDISAVATDVTALEVSVDGTASVDGLLTRAAAWDILETKIGYSYLPNHAADKLFDNAGNIKTSADVTAYNAAGDGGSVVPYPSNHANYVAWEAGMPMAKASTQIEVADGTGAYHTLEEQATIVAGTDGLTSQYTVKIETLGSGASARKVVGGFGLSAEPNLSSGSYNINFGILADKFFIEAPAGNQSTTRSTITPFSVVTSSQTFTDSAGGTTTLPSGVYMDAAFIKFASITEAHIGVGVIDTIHCGVMNASIINAGEINATYINLDNATISEDNGAIIIKDLGVDTAQINNLAVETLKIAGEAATVPYGTSSNLGVTIGYATGENITTWTAIDGGGLAQNYSSNVPSQVSIIVTQNFIGGTSSSGQADNVIDMALRISSDGGSTWLTGTGTDLGRVVHSTLEDYAFTLTSGFTFAPTGTGNVLIRLYARKLFNQSSWKTKNAHVVVLGTRK